MFAETAAPNSNSQTSFVETDQHSFAWLVTGIGPRPISVLHSGRGDSRVHLSCIYDIKNNGAMIICAIHSIVRHPWVYLLRRPKSSPAETVKQRYRLAIVTSALNDNYSQMQSDFPLLIQKTTGVFNGHSSSE